MASPGRTEPRTGPGSTAGLIVAVVTDRLGSGSGRVLGDAIDFLPVEEAAAVLRIGRTSAYLLCERWRYSGGQTGMPVVRGVYLTDSTREFGDRTG